MSGMAEEKGSKKRQRIGMRRESIVEKDVRAVVVGVGIDVLLTCEGPVISRCFDNSGVVMRRGRRYL